VAGLKLSSSDGVYSKLTMLSSLSSSSTPGIPAVCGETLPAKIIFNCSTEAMPPLLDSETDGDTALRMLVFRSFVIELSRSPCI